MSLKFNFKYILIFPNIIKGARIYCFEHLPDYKVDAEEEAEVMVILDSKGHKKLTIEFEYFACKFNLILI